MNPYSSIIGKSKMTDLALSYFSIVSFHFLTLNLTVNGTLLLRKWMRFGKWIRETMVA